MKQTEYYKELVSRNGFFISNKLQGAIKESTLVFIGCGLASTIAISASRLGFRKFILADGDRVELNNLNRQNFYLDDMGKNKARVVADKILKVNKYAEIDVIEKFIEAEDVEGIINQGDIIINSADFNKVTYKIEEISSLKNKLSISPLNIGFGSVITNFSNQSKGLKEMTGGVANSDKDYLLKFYNSLTGYRLPKYIKRNIVKIFLFVTRKGYLPQNVVAANISSGIILNTVLRYLGGKEVKFAPDPVAWDPEGSYES